MATEKGEALSKHSPSRASEQHNIAAEVSAQWFALYTAPRHEKSVLRSLMQKQIDAFLPLYRAKRKWKKRGQITLELPLFPNYVFVRIARHMRASVLGIPSVLSIVSAGREPLPISYREIEAIRAGLDLHIIEPHSDISVGERARIRTGPLAGMDGVVVRNNNNLRVVLTVATIMRSFAVEVDAENVEPLSDAHSERSQALRGC